jgi:hypothetical protein|tara:strand:- start:1292 stop:1579 length:288 start_codon:yes stop_codon:yes gene_type:complete
MKGLDYIGIIETIGIPMVAAIGMGYLVWLVVKFLMADIHKKLDTQHQMIVALIDRIRQMDNDMIRIDAMCRAAMGLDPDVSRIARADGQKDQRKD